MGHSTLKDMEPQFTYMISNINREQAGAELGQAQPQLGLKLTNTKI